ncbi:Zn-dependent protease with chaperone function [Actinoplanes octamycinicus]|uniref:Zn-dependent protease with chaperone function n=1 Tax=Actinoplanes octamycinicus TaxID=135948 RepID=A0A7W7MB69_9ACTN|nr:M48 family metalloprotease [Actinoplanes octamycinicus]MBB4743550.1 Zn-dependent protease with chaperone function [Actinoplanes octamycinicus]GIE62462.1 peptidase M48 [Actinoplanes octamycinicus]
MFDHFLWSVVVVPPLAVLVVRLLADRLAPGRAASVVAWSAVTVAATSTINLLLLAAHALAQVPAVGRLLGWSAAVVAADTAGVEWVPWLSLVLLVAVILSVTLRWRRQRRVLAMVPAAGPGGLVLLPDDAPRAFAVPGNPGHVVVTTGMRGLLTDPQFEALLAHEHAHLSEHHHRLARLAELAVAAHPALWWVGKHVDYLIERAADERAAASLGSRKTLAHAIGVAALAGAGSPFAAALHAAVPGGVVPKRVAHLLRPQPRPAPPLFLLLPAAVALSSVIWTGEATLDLVELIHAALR